MAVADLPLDPRRHGLAGAESLLHRSLDGVEEPAVPGQPVSEGVALDPPPPEPHRLGQLLVAGEHGQAHHEVLYQLVLRAAAEVGDALEVGQVDKGITLFNRKVAWATDCCPSNFSFNKTFTF